MTRTGQAAIDYARSIVGNGPPPPHGMPAPGYCLKYVRECFAVASYYASAVDAWNAAQARHPGDWNPPPAVPVYFRTPSIYDHVAITGNQPGEILTTYNDDVRRYLGSSWADVIRQIERDFDGPYLGWSEDINTVTVWTDEGDDLDMDEATVQRIVTSCLRAEGVSGAGVWTPGPYPDGSPTVGDRAAKIVHDEVGGVLSSSGVVGAADGTQPWAQKYVREIVAEELDEALTETSTTSRSLGLFVFALVVLVAVVGGVAVGVLADSSEGAVAAVAAIVGGLLATVLRHVPGRTP
jgi:hypothetical protein